jgi:hypothetical protein
MKANQPLNEIRVEFYDHSEQPLCDGYHSIGEAVPIPSVGDTFQGTRSQISDAIPTYVVERRHFQIASGGLTVRVYGRDIQVTGGL